MKTPNIEELAERIGDGPEITELFRKLRSSRLLVQADWETAFPPQSPTSTRRGGRKGGLPAETLAAVFAILDAQHGNSVDPALYVAAMRAGSGRFFRALADACDYLDGMSHAQSMFARHVIAVRRIAAHAIKPSGPLPRWREIKAEAIKLLGQGAFLENSREWGRVRKVAGLTDLPN